MKFCYLQIIDKISLKFLCKLYYYLSNLLISLCVCVCVCVYNLWSCLNLNGHGVCRPGRVRQLLNDDQSLTIGL